MLPSLLVQSVACVTRRCARVPGRWRLLRWLEQQRASIAALPPQTIRFAHGYRMCVDPIDENGRRAYSRGFDPNDRLTRHFLRLLRPGDGVIDVGANVGYYSLVAAMCVGRTGCVHAFEPSPHVLPLLRATAKLNPHAPLHVHGAAVIDRCGETELHLAASDRTGYTSIRDLGDESAASCVVPTICLDRLLPDLPTTRLIKIDIEGAELLALRGMEALLKRDHPHIVLELDDTFLRELGADARAVCEFLHDAGYGLHRIGARGELHPLRDPPIERCNVLAEPVCPINTALRRDVPIETGRFVTRISQGYRAGR